MKLKEGVMIQSLNKIQLSLNKHNAQRDSDHAFNPVSGVQ